MTSGYDAADPAAQGTGEAERLGPMPPRFNPPGPPTGSFAPPGPYPPAPPPASPPRYPGTPGQYPATASFPSAPLVPPGPSVPSVPPGSPVVPGYGPPPRPAAAPAPRRGGRLGVVAFVLVIALLAVVGVQAYLLVDLDRRLTRADRAAAAARADVDRRLKELDGRTGAIERRTLDPQAVAKDVLPSVFRVTAGDALGTAFALGKAAADGGTNLVTNYHVVEPLYRTGGRDVALEHQDQRFPGTIVKVDRERDLALVHTTEKFPRLVAASTPAQPGEPVVVVGAPLGLSNTVTTGVVSALRDTPDGPRLQFDAAINPGNSGGPVINAQRQVVGIATAKAQDAEGIGLAIPIAVACDALGAC